MHAQQQVTTFEGKNIWDKVLNLVEHRNQAAKFIFVQES